jgi:MFS family permease
MTNPTIRAGAASEGDPRQATGHGTPRRAVAVLLAAAFVQALGYSAWMPLLPLYLHSYVAPGSTAEIASNVGLLSGAYTLALFASAAWWGRLSDRHGRRLVLMAGFTAYLVGMFGSALAASLAQAYAARILSGVGAAAVIPAAQAYLADVSDRPARNRRFALLASASFIGFVTGPLLGTWLAGPVMRMSTQAMPWMVKLPLAVVAALGVMLLPMLAWSLHAPAPQAIDDAGAMPAICDRPFAGVSMILAGLAAYAVGSFETAFNLLGALRLGAAVGAIALLFVVCSGFMLVAQGLLAWRPLRERFERRWMAAVLALGAGFMLSAPRSPDMLSLGMTVAAVALSIGLVAPSLAYALLDHDAGAKGAKLGRLAAAGNLGHALGAFVSGGLFSLRPEAPFVLAALLLLCGSAGAWLYWRPCTPARAEVS